MNMQAEIDSQPYSGVVDSATEIWRYQMPETPDPYLPILLDCAEQLGTRLCRDALWHGKQCNWIGPSMEHIDGSWQIVQKSLGPDLYGGTAGIALFLAELYRQRPLEPVRQTAEAAMHHAIANRERILESTRAGYYCGLLGIADVTLQLSTQFDQQQWTEAADTVINELVALGPDSNGIDVIMGSAGAIPALIKLYQQTRNEKLIDLARLHGDQLLLIAESHSEGCSWDTLNTGDQHPHLTGYAHGTAGVAVALAELYKVTGECRYSEAAIAGFCYEQNHFDHEQQNWPDFRNLESMGISADTKVCAVAWCHGAAGIGLSRLRAHHLLDSDRLYSEAQVAVNTTQRQLEGYLQSPGFDFTYCHGVAGDLELLLEADAYLGEKRFRDYTCQVIQWGIGSYEQAGLAWPCGVPDAGESPSLFLGTAGIGHFMLRAAQPEIVHSVLMPGPNRRVSQDVVEAVCT